MMTSKTQSLHILTLKLLLVWFCCGCIATIAGFSGLFYQPLAILLIAPILLLVIIITKVAKVFFQLTPIEKTVLSLIVFWWLLHSLQVFTPETGFDAVWYHLPLAEQTLTYHRFLANINFYQSFNPQFSDSIFYLGYAAAGEIGAKMVAYLFGLSLMLVTYLLSKVLLNRTWSLLVVLIVSGFQVVSWQSSSFYVDIAKAFWELSALWLIVSNKPKIVFSSLALGASIASKLFSILLLPVMLVILLIKKKQVYAPLFILYSLLIVTPFYVFAQIISGNAFYSLFHHLGKIGEIGGAQTTQQYLELKTTSLPKIVCLISLSKEYTTPLLLLFLPLCIKYWHLITKDSRLLSLAIFSFFQLLLWWYLPPTSIRYTLSGFISATIVTVFLLKMFAEKRAWNNNWLVGAVLVCGILFMPIRLAVTIRSAVYLLNLQTKEQYLQQFFDGNIDTHLIEWHKDVFFNN